MVRRLNDEQLRKLSTKNLLALYKKVRSVDYNTRLDDDEEWHGSRAQEFRDYRRRIKRELDSREHVERDTTTGDNINHKTRNQHG